MPPAASVAAKSKFLVYLISFTKNCYMSPASGAFEAIALFGLKANIKC